MKKIFQVKEQRIVKRIVQLRLILQSLPVLFFTYVTSGVSIFCRAEALQSVVGLAE